MCCTSVKVKSNDAYVYWTENSEAWKILLRTIKTMIKECATARAGWIVDTLAS